MSDSPAENLHIHVDEAGAPTLFANRRHAIVGTESCSRFFILGKFHRLVDAYDVCVARRGQSDRNEALRIAIDYAERDFTAIYGCARVGRDDWRIGVSTPKTVTCLQAVDYFLWALQRFYEPRLDKESGLSKREEPS